MIDMSQRPAKDRPPLFTVIRVRTADAALLSVVLTDNAREWNKELRRELDQIVTSTEYYNARCRLEGRGEDKLT